MCKTSDILTVGGIVAAPFTGGLSLLATATGVQMKQAEKAADAQQEAARVALKQSEDAAKTADQQFNKLNQKKPNIAGLAAANLPGANPTMLSGGTGVSTSGMPLGNNSLLGS